MVLTLSEIIKTTQALLWFVFLHIIIFIFFCAFILNASLINSIWLGHSLFKHYGNLCFLIRLFCSFTLNIIIDIVLCLLPYYLGFPCSSVGNESACNAGDQGLIPGSGRSSGEGNGNPLQYAWLENPMDRGAWQTIVHGVAKVRHDLATEPSPPSYYLSCVCSIISFSYPLLFCLHLGYVLLFHFILSFFFFYSVLPCFLWFLCELQYAPSI